MICTPLFDASDYSLSKIDIVPQAKCVVFHSTTNIPTTDNSQNDTDYYNININ